MIATAAKLVQRVLGWQVVFTLAVGLLLVSFAPGMLLLRGPVGVEGARLLLFALLAGGAFSVLRSWWILRRHRFVLRALALGSRSVEPFELEELGDEPWRVTVGWLVPSVLALTAAGTLFRPAIIDLTTGISLALLGSVIAAAAALPLHVIVRADFLRAIELGPPEVMREVVEGAEKTGLPQRRVPRRLMAAVVTPVAFVTIGAALIANAHLRRADERQREETARVLARSSFELGPGVISGAGISDAAAHTSELGFTLDVRHESAAYRAVRGEDGVIALTTPLEEGSAIAHFSGSTVGVLSIESVFLALLAIAVAAFVSSLFGRSLSVDLHNATRGVRLLGTEAVLSGATRVVRPARFAVVAELGHAIERLADRFRVFARAQERAIEAREATTRMRGLFFASVSHDLKSPLNAILGFTAVVSQTEDLSPDQRESLEMIERRGRELLALIETILDAARVEAGQLDLVREPVAIDKLLTEAIAKGEDLGGDQPVEVVSERTAELGTLHVDRVRVARALATFIGHAIRTASEPVVRVRAARADAGQVGIEIDVPSTRFRTAELEAMLNPTRQPGASGHRGLALGLGLARSVIELHGGSVTTRDRGGIGPTFCVRLPGSG